MSYGVKGLVFGRTVSIETTPNGVFPISSHSAEHMKIKSLE